MRSITSYDFRKVLEEYGVAILTGEGCNYGLRLVTDVSPHAQRAVEEFYGMRLLHEGMNGWACNPDGEWMSGASKAFDWQTHQLREGWSHHRGFSMNLPRDDMESLLVFLLLQRDNYVVIVESGRDSAIEFGITIYVMDENEWRQFANARDAIYMGEAYELDRDDKPGHVAEYVARYNLHVTPKFPGRATNRHAMSGKLID